MALPKSHFNFIFKCHSFTCVGVDMHMLWHVGGGVSEDSLLESIISFHYTSTRIRLWLSGLTVRAFNQWVISSAHLHFLPFSPLWVCALSVCSCVCKCVCLYRFTHIWWVCCMYICLCVGVGTNTCVCACILSLLSSYFLSLWDSGSPLPKAHI